MERTFGVDDRIRRAEEIYARRQNLRERTKKARVNVSEPPKNLKLFKRLILQVTICILIYSIFHLINTTNYSFSSEALSKTKELITVDYDFVGIYNNIINSINNYLYPNDEKKEDDKQSDTTQDEGNTETTNEGNNEAHVENDESLTQSEIVETEISETERIKKEYAFILPVTRICFVGIWDKRGYFKCCYCIS